MIDTTYSVDMFRFDRALQRFWAYSRKSIGEITKSQARLFAVELARRTQPFGSDHGVRDHSRFIVRSDILRVFLGPAAVEQFLSRLTPSSLVDWVRRALKTGNQSELRTAWNSLTGRDTPVSQTVDSHHHKSQRNRRGKVVRRPQQMIVMDGGSLRSYLNRKERLSGFGKSGWAQAARDLGGTRGIPGWVTRNRGPGSGRDLTASPVNPRVVLSNEVTYASDIISPFEIERAAFIQSEKMENAIDAAISYEAGRAGFKSTT